MLIKQSRVRSVRRHFGHLPPTTPLVLGVRINADVGPWLARAGFEANPSPGTVLLPAEVGPVSRFNAEGKHKKLKHLPKETAYRQVEWSWKEFHGREVVERAEVRDVPYERYQREFVPPPSVQLEIASTPAGAPIVLARCDGLTPVSEALLHVVNLLLELFGQCEVLSAGLSPLLRAPERLVNWEILPVGEMPWESVRQAVEPALNRAPAGNRPVIEHRFTTLQRYRPDFYAVGRGGFRGYVVFGFERKGLYFLESVRYGNATYVLERDWERLSQMTKAEILNENSHRARLIHRAGSWESQVRELLTSPDGAVA